MIKPTVIKVKAVVTLGGVCDYGVGRRSQLGAGNVVFLIWSVVT
jgi:hypothetical protein